MTFTQSRYPAAILVAFALLVAACSSAETPSANEASTATVPVTEQDQSSESGDAIETSSTTTAAPDEQATDGESGSPEPLRVESEPTPPAAEPTSNSAWISRTSMTASSIGLTWALNEEAVEYQIHRIPKVSDAEPAVEEMTDENLVHTATDAGRFEDDGVEPGSRYWYGLRELSADGDLLAHGWHETAAVDDEEPPSIVDGLTATQDGSEVLISWSQPAENFALHGYRVLRSVDDEPAERVAITWRIDQTSFIDGDAPTSGTVEYQVLAFDFHWNEGMPGTISLDLS